MPKVYSDDYFTVVAGSKDDAVQFFLENQLTDEEGSEEIMMLGETENIEIISNIHDSPDFLGQEEGAYEDS